MIINETFMWLYAAYKFGEACTALAIFSTILCVIAIPLSIEGGERGEAIARFIWIASLFVLPFALSIAALTPGKAELKMYATYAIGKDVANSNEAKRLFDAAHKYLEGETKNEN